MPPLAPLMTALTLRSGLADALSATAKVRTAPPRSSLPVIVEVTGLAFEVTLPPSVSVPVPVETPAPVRVSEPIRSSKLFRSSAAPVDKLTAELSAIWSGAVKVTKSLPDPSPMIRLPGTATTPSLPSESVPSVTVVAPVYVLGERPLRSSLPPPERVSPEEPAMAPFKSSSPPDATETDPDPN